MSSDIARLVNLQRLEFNSNQLEYISPHSRDLPSALGTLRSLVHLDLSQNILKNIAPCVLDLENLEALNLSQNNIEDVDIPAGKLPNLKVHLIEL